MQQLGKNQIQKNAGKPTFISPVLLVPKAAISIPVNYRAKGRSSDLLHFFAAFPSALANSGKTGSEKA